jgi:GTP-binding protein
MSVAIIGNEKTEVTVSKPIVAIIGKPNVGKSTLLNRVAGKRIAIIEDTPGTTRDRIAVDVSWQGTGFTLVDTGGLETKPESAISREVRDQVEVAMTEADAILFLVDARDGVTTSDQEVADVLRRTSKPVILAANKVDNTRLENQAAEFYGLGLKEPLPVSAYHGRGIEELLDRVVSLLPPTAPPAAEPEMMKVALVGRPNVGKSMLLNALLGQERAIVNETPGTTRDAIDTQLDFQGQNVLLIDTAGIRRRGKIGAGIERYGVIRALRAIERADIALLVIDSTEPVTAQDLHIAGYVHQEAKGIIIIVNKWDLVDDKNTTEWNGFIRDQFKFMPYAPVLYTSAMTGQGVNGIMPQARAVYQERLKRVSTSIVNSVMEDAVAAHNPPRKGKRRLRILYATQAEVNPPTFVLFVNDARMLHFSYQRYLENKLRQAFGFTGTPLRLIFRTKGES